MVASMQSPVGCEAGPRSTAAADTRNTHDRRLHKIILLAIIIMSVSITSLAHKTYKTLNYCLDFKDFDPVATFFYWGPQGLLQVHEIQQVLRQNAKSKTKLKLYLKGQWTEESMFSGHDENTSCVIVGGSASFTMPGEFLKAKNVESAVPSDCKTWFITNPDLYDHPNLAEKIVPIPLGVDYGYRTCTTHPFIAGFSWQRFLRPWALFELPKSPWQQEQELLDVYFRSKPSKERIPKVYSDWHFNRNYGRKFPHFSRGEGVHTLDRSEIFEQTKNNDNIVFAPYRLPQVTAWEEKSRYAFELSVFGYGIDCHRTWEALALGMIVITMDSPINILYEGLPVVIIQHLSEINARNLELWLNQYGPLTRRPEVRYKLTNDYIVKKILKALRSNNR